MAELEYAIAGSQRDQSADREMPVHIPRMIDRGRMYACDRPSSGGSSSPAPFWTAPTSAGSPLPPPTSPAPPAVLLAPQADNLYLGHIISLIICAMHNRMAFTAQQAMPAVSCSELLINIAVVDEVNVPQAQGVV